MAVDFNLFAKAGNVGQQAATAQDRPKAQLWANIGYSVPTPTEEDKDATTFVSFPIGIPVDTQEHREIKGNNKRFRDLCSAQNSLLDAVVEAGMSMAPGEAKILNLQIELRRVNGPQEATKDEDNIFVLPNLLG